ncbi:glycosyltransferase [Pengzhenrongella sicca]|uniref:Glycosyltransferase n=1 Tax=Pengzhenrongella sicca TaxID=2819238 RepID=A0A8A4ZF65_9MICO|nr:glycosyltransferase [Pengzhenrongella sicca]QTE29649.1 hypothetical protein J4E96_00875 [Pengzhenrongella sicca]
MTSAATSDPGANPFPSMWFDAVRRAGVDARAWSSIGLLVSRPDVVHVHWPEPVFGRVGRSPRRAVVMASRLAALLVAKARGTRVAWTVHNLEPHDQRGDVVGRAGIRLFQRLVDEFWVMSQASGNDVRARFGPGCVTRVITHPAYPVHGPSAPPPERAEVLSFGEVRPYRGFLELVETFAASSTDCSLTLIGAGRDDDYARVLRAAVAGAGNATWLDARLGDEALQEHIRACDVVILNYLQVTNSGAALLALSLDRPVVLPDTPVFRELRDEVGDGWVFLFDTGVLPTIEACLTQERPAPPNLERRTWAGLGVTVRQASTRLRADRTHRLLAPRRLVDAR